nr:MAG TPA_asm: hypothetical protein [Caudoviricetes sp.]
MCKRPCAKVGKSNADRSRNLILSSSTEGSTKKFKITVDDTGALTATEVITS